MSAATYHFFIPDLGPCCRQKIQNTLEAEKNVTKVDIDLQGNVIVSTAKKIDTSLLESKLKTMGYTLQPAPTSPLWGYWFNGLLAGIAGFGLFILCTCGFMIPTLAMYCVGAVCTLILFYVGYDIYFRALNEILEMKYLSMNSLLAVSTLTLLAISIASLFLPALGLPLFFDTALMIFFFFYIGKIIQEYATQTAAQSHLRGRVTLKTTRISKNENFGNKLSEIFLSLEKEQILTSELKPGNIIKIEASGVIPVDCEYLQSTEGAVVFDKMQTGRELYELKAGQTLLAGAEVTEGTVYLKVIKPENQSELVRLEKQLKKAAAGKIEIETQVIDKALRFFVPSIFLFALVAGLCVGFLFTPLLGLQTGLSIIVAICPCMLGLIIPLAIKAAQNKAIHYDLLINSSRALEIAKQVDAIFFDLNGTLTEGKPSVDEKFSTTDSDILKYFYILQKDSKHRIGKTICNFIDNNHSDAKKNDHLKIESIEEKKQDQVWIEKIINGEYYAAGDQDKILKHGISQKEIDAYLQGKFKDKPLGQIIFLSKGTQSEKKIIGHIVLKDQLRSDAKQLFETLEARNIACHIFTGSAAADAYPYARELGISEDKLKERVKTNCAETSGGFISKQDCIANLENEGHCVAVVIDQPNDILAIHPEDKTKKRLSIAVNSADEAIKTEAQVVITTNKLMPILHLLDLSQQFIRHVKQNLMLNFIYNITAVTVPLILLFTIGLALNPAWAAGLVILQSVLVLLSVYYFYCETLPSISNSPAKKTPDTLLNTAIAEGAEIAMTPAPPLLSQQYVSSPSADPSPAKGEGVSLLAYSTTS